MLMPGAPDEIQDLLMNQIKKLLQLLTPGIPSKEKMTRAMLAIVGVIHSIAPPPMPKSLPSVKPDIKLTVKIALDTLGVK
jgi:hypothetical protein